ncbi:Telomeric repeat-binding factor 2 [Mycobacteroides abscessus subsp. abscessus]|nr:Telomeric repeat-binding factor 2 [Mycobacteroides abscessus subsp. abscessus]
MLNLGQATHSFLGDEQKLKDATGKEYTPDSMANILARNAEQLEPGAELGPGAQKRSVLVYDVPRGTVPKEIALHSGYNSKGAKVVLG